jgi:hypothetical protein
MRMYGVKMEIGDRSAAHRDDWTVNIPTGWRKLGPRTFKAFIANELLDEPYPQKRILMELVKKHHNYRSLDAMLEKVAEMIIGEIYCRRLRARHQQRDRKRSSPLVDQSPVGGV